MPVFPNTPTVCVCWVFSHGHLLAIWKGLTVVWSLFVKRQSISDWFNPPQLVWLLWESQTDWVTLICRFCLITQSELNLRSDCSLSDTLFTRVLEPNAKFTSFKPVTKFLARKPQPHGPIFMWKFSNARSVCSCICIMFWLWPQLLTRHFTVCWFLFPLNITYITSSKNEISLLLVWFQISYYYLCMLNKLFSVFCPIKVSCV